MLAMEKADVDCARYKMGHCGTVGLSLLRETEE